MKIQRYLVPVALAAITLIQLSAAPAMATTYHRPGIWCDRNLQSPDHGVQSSPFDRPITCELVRLRPDPTPLGFSDMRWHRYDRGKATGRAVLLDARFSGKALGPGRVAMKFWAARTGIGEGGATIHYFTKGAYRSHGRWHRF